MIEEPVGIVTVPVNVGEAVFAFKPILVAVVVAKFASSPRALASSSRVFKVAGAESTRLATAVATNAVVAICVVFVAADAVGAVGTPVRSGEARAALASNCV